MTTKIAKSPLGAIRSFVLAAVCQNEHANVCYDTRKAQEELLEAHEKLSKTKNPKDAWKAKKAIWDAEWELYGVLFLWHFPDIEEERYVVALLQRTNRQYGPLQGYHLQ